MRARIVCACACVRVCVVFACVCVRVRAWFGVCVHTWVLELDHDESPSVSTRGTRCEYPEYPM